MTDDVLVQTANNILNRMMGEGHFSICDVDKAAQLLGAKPQGEAYEVLRKLHCVNWRDMPPELLASVPELITAALAVSSYRFNFTARAPAPRMFEAGKIVELESPKRPTLIRRLLGHD